MTKKVVVETLQKGQQKKKRQTATKRCQEIDKKGGKIGSCTGLK